MEDLKIEEENGVRSKVLPQDGTKLGSNQEGREQQFTEMDDNVVIALQTVGTKEEKPPDEYSVVGTTEMHGGFTEYIVEEKLDMMRDAKDITAPRALVKVDKSVGTNDTLEDLQRALTYEIIFSTLLEKKVLAIKRECEERKRAKRMERKSIGRILFSRKLFGGSHKSRGDSEPDVFMRGELGAVLTSPPAPLRTTKAAKKATSSRDERHIGDEIEIVSCSASNGSQRSQIKQATRAQKVHDGAAAGSAADDSITSTLSNSSDKNGIGAVVAESGGALPLRKHSLLVRAQTHTPAEVMTSSSGSGDSRAHAHRRSMSGTNGNGNGAMGGLPISLLERTYDTTSLASGYDNGTCARLHTSTMADDSLTSLRDSIEGLSFASSHCAVSFGGAEIIPEEAASLLYERARIAKRLRILEAKSISAQCSPILPRHLINAIAAPPPELVSPLAKLAPSNETSLAATASAARHINTPTTAVPYSVSASKVATAISTTSGSVIQQTVPVTTSNKITQTKQHIFRHQVSYTDSTYGGAGDFGDASAYSRYISRQNTSEDSANLTVSTFLNQSDSLSLHAPIYSPTGSATGGDSGGVAIGAFMLGARFKSKSTSLLVVRGNGRSCASPQTQILRAPLAEPMRLTDGTTTIGTCVSGIMPSNIIHNEQLVDSLNTKTFASAGNAPPNRIISQSKTTTTAAGNVIFTQPYPSSTHAAIYESIPSDSQTTTAVIALNGSGFRNGNVSGVIVSSSAVPGDTSKLNRMTSTSTGSSVAPTGCCTTTKSSSRDRGEEKQRFIPNWPSRQSGSDDEYRKRKRKYKRHHRCSDPVLVYPTPNGLQHCILSMPSNEPLQLQYNDDFAYDLQIEMDSDKTDDLEEIVPSNHHRHRRHRHNRHKKRHRHKNPKILVQDLETRVVKVVDPDDLSQRARWTIIVTACLLLIMCLMLVGITLRMAPLIDDMGVYVSLLFDCYPCVGFCCTFSN
ncbi:uncharacterized protein [Eurosta solidaginis]|uniref:uncharacterized protein isoform X2 n=1 Tax=Eurosta solidaginis TaxID=178769 RepID=UPI0035312BE2